jgi:4'-phosphopantetheinyl transferase
MSENNSQKIKILYAFFGKRLTEPAWTARLRTLPEPIHERILRYGRWEDRQACMLGYLMLQEALQKRDHTVGYLKDLWIDRFGRPYVAEGVDFNISHTDGWVTCAVADHGRIGIDIEKIRPIDLWDFKDHMSRVQWQRIKESGNPYETFYDFWTLKESVLKADGRGLSVPLEQVENRGNKVVLEGKTWHVKKLCIVESSSCHLASESESPRIEMRQAEVGEGNPQGFSRAMTEAVYIKSLSLRKHVEPSGYERI